MTTSPNTPENPEDPDLDASGDAGSLDGDKPERLGTFTRRLLLNAGWSIPVVAMTSRSGLGAPRPDPTDHNDFGHNDFQSHTDHNHWDEDLHVDYDPAEHLDLTHYDTDHYDDTGRGYHGDGGHSDGVAHKDTWVVAPTHGDYEEHSDLSWIHFDYVTHNDERGNER